MGGKDSGAPIDPQQTALTQDANALTAIAQQQNTNAQTLFGSAFPGFKQAEQFYTTLSSGDPNAIARATAPATQQIDAATASAKKNILQNGPAGGQTNLALEQADVSQGAQVGGVASNAYLGSFNALAQLAGQGVGESISSAGTGISGLSAAGQTSGESANLAINNRQLQDQEKGSTLGALSSLGGDVAGAAGQAGSFAALFAGI